jgi:hypothetical protein
VARPIPVIPSRKPRQYLGGAIRWALLEDRVIVQFERPSDRNVAFDLWSRLKLVEVDQGGHQLIFELLSEPSEL